jgi:DNA replication protein DnaC
LFHRVLEREIERKNERRVATCLKLSGLPTGRTLEGFDWTFQPRADRSKLAMLATCASVRARENVLFLGPPRLGKSHFAVSLGMKAIKNAFSVTLFMLDDLMHAPQGGRGSATGTAKAKRYLNTALLTVDEVGFRPLDRHEANPFFRLISARYEKGSIVLETDAQDFRGWRYSKSLSARSSPYSSQDVRSPGAMWHEDRNYGQFSIGISFNEVGVPQ